MPNAKLLIVEDEEIVAFDMESTLKGLNYDVLGIVASGEEAIATAATTQPDLVLMDIMLKGRIDGIEAAREIRSLFHIPVIYLTAYADADTFERAKATEPFGYLIKPFEEKELQTTIEIALARHQSEERMRQRLEQEQENNEQKSQFISIASHEFRTPLATIHSSSALLQRYCRDAMDEKKSKHFQQIQTSIDQMTQLLDDVLVIGQADAGKLEFKAAPLNLVEFCRNLVEELQLNAGNHHKIAFTSQGNCANTCLDATLLRRILTNLLSNAIKYSPQGGDVFFELSCQAEVAKFCVKDEGIGIPPEEQKELFTPFHRAANAQKIKGTGLGLSIVKRCVDVHGGQISGDSKIGLGTKSTVTLPLEGGKGKG